MSSGAVIKKTELVPFQNPVRDYLKIPAHFGAVALKVYDLRGNLVLQKQNQQNSVYIGNLKAGQYLVLLEWEKMDEVLDFKMMKI
jgi:hypothetical protein